MASNLDNENTDLENYGTWVKKDLQTAEAETNDEFEMESMDISELSFDNDEDDLDLGDDFLNDIDSLDIEDQDSLEDFNLDDIQDLDDDLISPEEEDELISMSEDNWEPDENLGMEDWGHEETELTPEDSEAAGDFLEQSEDSVTESPIEEPVTSAPLKDHSMDLVERQTRLLEKIESELSVIKDEILDIRSQLGEKPLSPVSEEAGQEPIGEAESQPEVKGFFEEDDDESIVLTGDELDNIINTAEMTTEAGEDNVNDLGEEDPGLSLLSEPDIFDSGEAEEELSLDTEELSLDTEELSLDTEELSLDTEELSLDTEELSLDTEELSLDTEELSLDTEELSLDEEELSLDEEELSLDEEELSLDEEELSLDEEELSLDEEVLSLEEEVLSLDEEELSLDEEELSLDEEELSLDEEELSLDEEELSLDEEELSLDEEELSLDEEELSLDEEELSLDEEELSLDEEELSLDEEELSLDEEELSLDEEELSLDEEELSLDEEELSLDTEELSLDEEELSLDEEELSLDEEELSLDEEELSLDEEELSLDEEELSLDEEELSPIEELELDEEEIVLDEYELPDMDEKDVSEDEDSELLELSDNDSVPEIEEVSMDEFDTSTGEGLSIDHVISGIDEEELVIDLAEDTLEESEEEALEEIDLDSFDTPSQSEETDVPFEEVEDVSLDDLLGDSEFTAVESPEQTEEEPFDFDLDITEIDNEDFDEGEVVNLDDELDIEELEIEDETSIEELIPEESSESLSEIGLPELDENLSETEIQLDNSDLPDLEDIDSLEISDDDLPGITESETEITLDLSEQIGGNEPVTTEEDELELPGTEDIDLNSLEALATIEEPVTDDSSIDLFEESEEPIEIDLDDISEEITDEVSDLIDDTSEEEAEEDLVAIELPSDADLNTDLQELVNDGSEDDDNSEELLQTEPEAEEPQDLKLDEPQDLEVVEEPEEFQFEQDLEEEQSLNPEAIEDTTLKESNNSADRTGVDSLIPTANALAQLDKQTSLEHLPKDIKDEIRDILTYMDQLLESLPEDKIQEFARSEHFEVYKKIFEELGISS